MMMMVVMMVVVVMMVMMVMTMSCLSNVSKQFTLFGHSTKSEQTENQRINRGSLLCFIAQQYCSAIA